MMSDSISPSPRKPSTHTSIHAQRKIGKLSSRHQTSTIVSQVDVKCTLRFLDLQFAHFFLPLVPHGLFALLIERFTLIIRTVSHSSPTFSLRSMSRDGLILGNARHKLNGKVLCNGSCRPHLNLKRAWGRELVFYFLP